MRKSSKFQVPSNQFRNDAPGDVWIFFGIWILDFGFLSLFPITRMAAVLPGIRDNSLAGAFGCDGENGS
jgi:hypothetical protein